MLRILQPNRLVVALLLIILISACDKKTEKKRPMDPWVFRSVLDKKPRMVTAALDDNLFVAYDARACQIYKAWKGGVTFLGRKRYAVTRSWP